jgi:hypothetical protein
MSTEITINQDIVEINVTEEVVVIEAPSGAYPLPSMVSSVFGRTGNVVAQEGDYTLTQLGDVTISTPSNGQVLRYNGTTWVNATESFAGTVTSVDMSVPTGLTISGNPITTSGTLAVGLGAGYVIPTQAALDAKQDDLNGTGIVKSTAGTITYLSDNTANWNTAYNDSIVSASVTGTATKTLTLNQQDGGSVTASWTDTDTGLTSVGLSMPSAFSVANSPLTANGTLSVTGAGTTAQYVRGDGSLAIFPSLTGFVPYTGATTNVNLGTHSLTAADLVINHVSGSGVAASITKGGSGEALTVIKTSGSGNAASITGGVTLLDELHLTTDLADAYIASAATWNAKQNAITLTTTGTSGAATLVGATLNIPQYQGVLTNPVTGTGTTNTLPKFTGASTIGNSNITDSGTLITLGSNSYVNGAMGIGTTSITSGNVNLFLARNLTGDVNVFSVNTESIIQSDVTTHARYFRAVASTAAAAFTLPELTYYESRQGTFGAGSIVGTQQGFVAGTTLIGGTNNYGFRGRIPSGTNRWNLFMDGTAANYLAGQLLIGTTTITAFTANSLLDVNGDARISNSLYYKLFGTSSNYYRVGILAGTANFEIYNTNIGRTDLLITQSTGAATFSNSVTAASFIPTSSTIPTNGMYLSGTNTLGFATNGTLDMVLDANGSLGIGSTSLAGYTLRATKNITGGTTSYGMTIDGQIQSDVTTQAWIFQSNVSTAAATFNIAGGVRHFFARGVTMGAGSTMGNQFGFHVDASLTTGSSNFAFYSGLAAGTNRWNIYMDGTANNYMAGRLGIGSTDLVNVNLNLQRNITGNTTSIGAFVGGNIQSDVTSGARLIQTNAQTAAASFTIPNLIHYYANQGTFGAGSVVTAQTAFFVEGNFSGATINRGLRSLVPFSANNWNLFIDGTANNYLAGSLGIGSTSLTGYNLRIQKVLTGATNSRNIWVDSQIASDVTSVAAMVGTSPSTQAASFTLGTLIHFYANQSTLGAGSSVTNQYGFWADSGITGATNNYGFYGNIPSGTNRWNLYMAGSAANYMAGGLGIGTTAIGSFLLYVSGQGLIAGNTYVVTGQQGLTIGADSNLTISSANTSKRGRINVPQYGSPNSTPIGIIQGSTDASNNTIIIGGTQGGYALAADIITFQIGATYNATSGTEIARFNSVGSLGLGTGASINASARLQVDSTTQGFLPPRMTTTQKLAIGTPAAGLMVYDTTLNQMSYYNGTLWINF